MIKGLVEAGDVLGAQKEIMRELEVEIGNVAIAMGETSLGAIKKYETAWINLKEELGETATTLKAELIEALNIDEAVDGFTNKIAQGNAKSKFIKLIDADLLKEQVILTQTSQQEITDAYEGFNTRLSYLISEIDKEEDKLGVFQDKDFLESLKEEKGEIYDYMDALQAFSVVYAKFQEDLQKDIDSDSGTDTNTLADGAEAWLDALIRVENQKSKILTLDEIAAKYDEKKFSRDSQTLSIVEQGVKLGYASADIWAILDKYTLAYRDNLKESEAVERELLQTQARRKYIDNYGTEEQQKSEEYKEKLIELNAIMAMGVIGYVEYIEAIKALNEEAEAFTIPEDLGGFINMFDDFLFGADAVDTFRNSIEDVKNTLETLAIDAVAGSFHSLGESIANGTDAVADWGNTLGGLVDATLEAIGPQLMLAGATALATNPANPVGWALLAAGGAASFFGGLLDFSGTGAAGGGSSSAIESSNDINTTTIGERNLLASTQPNITTNIINNTGADVSTQTSSRNGETVIETVIDSSVTATANRYNLQRTGVPVR